MQTRTDSPLTYHERLPQVERFFHLYDHRVEITARWTLGRTFQTVVKLADLAPESTRFTIRNKWFKRSVMVGAIAIGLALFLSRGTLFAQARVVALFCWPVAGVASVVACRSFRKRQFARFMRKDGRPGLDICKTDPDAFEAFLREVQAKIRKA